MKTARFEEEEMNPEVKSLNLTLVSSDGNTYLSKGAKGRGN